MTLKKGWKTQKEKIYGGYNGNFTIYEITAPNGNVYKLHNGCDKYPHFYMETNTPGHYDKSVGSTFNEAMNTLYQLEEKHAFKTAKELEETTVYEHRFSESDGYSYKELDPDHRFYQSVQKLHVFSVLDDFLVYSGDSAEAFTKARNLLFCAAKEHYESPLRKRIKETQRQLDNLHQNLGAMFDASFPEERNIESLEAEEREY